MGAAISWEWVLQKSLAPVLRQGQQRDEFGGYAKLLVPILARAALGAADNDPVGRAVAGSTEAAFEFTQQSSGRDVLELPGWGPPVPKFAEQEGEMGAMRRRVLGDEIANQRQVLGADAPTLKYEITQSGSNLADRVD